MAKYQGASQSAMIGQRRSWSYYIFAVAMIVMPATLSVQLGFDIAGAAPREANEIEGFVMGHVTGKRENLLQIDNKEYPFFADVIVKDQNLTPMALKDIVPGTQVMFHLKQGRIDQIIILLPS